MKTIKRALFILVAICVMAASAMGNVRKPDVSCDEESVAVIAGVGDMQGGAAGGFNRNGGAMRGDPDIQNPGNNGGTSGNGGVVGDITEGVGDIVGGITEGVGDIVGGNDTAGNGDGNDANTENNAPNGVITEGDPNSTATAPATGDTNADAGMNDGGINWFAVICWVLIGVAVVALILVLIPKRRDR